MAFSCQIRAASYYADAIMDEEFEIILTEKGNDKKIRPKSSNKCIIVRCIYDSSSKNVNFIFDRDFGFATVGLFNPFNGAIVSYSQLSTPGSICINIPDIDALEIRVVDESGRVYSGSFYCN